MKTHNLVVSMRRHGNCYDNAVAESYFQLLKRERIFRKTNAGREETLRNIFDYVELFYNEKPRHDYAYSVAPLGFEKQYFNRLDSVY